MSEQARLLEDLVSQQKQTNQLLLSLNQSILALVDALAEEPEDPDQEPRTYLNGQPVN